MLKFEKNSAAERLIIVLLKNVAERNINLPVDRIVTAVVLELGIYI